MDVAAFSDDNFDVKEWINKTFKSTEAQDDKDGFVSSLVSKLQLYVQQVNGSLEETSQSVLSNLPRILRDTQLLQQEAIALKDKMIIVKDEIVRVEKNTALSMVSLENIDRMKTDLQLAKERLHEADNWTVLANDVEEVFESGDVENIAIKLFSMQKSLTMLINATDYEEKKLQLEGLKNRLEAITSPQVVQSFTQNNYDKSKYYVEIFRKIDRLPQLLKYYHNCVKVSLLQEWRKIIEQFHDNTNTIAYSLHLFYDKLLSEWQNQLRYFNQIFSLTKIDNLIDIYSDLLRNLDPSLTDCIQLSLKQHESPMQLTILMELKQITRNFSNNLNTSIDITLKSTNELSDSNKLLQLAQAIYSPYITFISKYNIYETALLSQQLNSINCNHDDLSDIINSMSLSVSKVIDYSLEANKRCKLFTNGCNYHGLLKALNNFFKQYIEKYNYCLKQIERRMSKHEDWNLFQMCLTLLQTIGELLVQIEQFEKTLVINIVEVNNKLSSSTISEFKQYKILLLTQAGRNELNELILSLQNNDTTILNSIKKLIYKLCGDLHRTTYEVIFAPIYTQLMFIQKAPAWSNNINNDTGNDNIMNLNADLPDFSFAPQEYITQVGQYLMTLPQHLEPFLLRDNPSLMYALKAADTQYTTGSSESSFTDILLGIIAKGTCQMFQDQALSISELNSSACKQLATDIDYLGNVLDELGLSLSINLQQMSLLLRLTVDDYLTGSVGCNARIVAAIRQMRNIASSG
ncbi:hypothetical protein PV327_010735 [Microctonus hyperodae]|uniref:Conserved oligomeric Golgi complex subunit 7 n=1 Tax=Microctonus hyperodae TaxID=165561 RepID=A0AA39C823_MICHY|nr:hypothetical protein PV327_010735 [Microctonus hyperodae]